MRKFAWLTAGAALIAASACDVNVENEPDANEQAQATPQQDQQVQDPWADPEAEARARDLAARSANPQQVAEMRKQARAEMEDVRLVVDQSERKLYIYRGEQEMRTHDVAVGTEENPTPTGEFSFHRVDLNPRWVPPNSDWAEDREEKAPGDPDNPMGRARLVYQMPYTIHGTDALDSLGKAVSHGSIRLANEQVIPLAELLLKAGGSWQGEEWFKEMTGNRDEEYQIPLDEKVSLTIRE